MLGKAMEATDWETLSRAKRRVDSERSSLQLQRALSWLTAAEVLVAAFIFGHSRGPQPMTLREAALLVAVVGLVSLVFSWMRRDQDLERWASLVLEVRESGQDKRFCLFADHLLIGRELLPKEAFIGMKASELGLQLEFWDPDSRASKRWSLKAPKAFRERIEHALLTW